MSKLIAISKLCLDRYYRVLRFLIAVLLGLMIVPVSMQVLSRYTQFVPRYIWTEEMARFCFVWIIMIGSMIAVRDGSHFEVDLLPRPTTKRGKGISQLIVHSVMIILAILFVCYGLEYARFGFRQTSEMSEINMLGIFIAFPIAGLTWLLFLLEHLAGDISLILQKKKESAS